jgi:hypothetical protein
MQFPSRLPNDVAETINRWVGYVKAAGIEPQ